MILQTLDKILEIIDKIVGFLDNIIPSLIPFFLTIGEGFGKLSLVIAGFNFSATIVSIACSLLVIGAFAINFFIIKKNKEK
ncbi:MAG: hypothetical protein ACTSRK_00165 [Promethearchaeota archaeon]